jgi:tetratricopeptide (TPR) repeat protein
VRAAIARTQAIKAAGTPEQLLQVVQQHAANLNDINLTAAFTTAVQLCHKHTQSPSQPAAVQRLLTQLQQLVQRLQENCGTRALSNIIWSCERLGSRDTGAQLLPVFLQSSKLQQANAQDISNVLLAVAKLQLQLTAEQLQDMMPRFEEVLPDAAPQAVANTLWAVATMGQQVPAGQLLQMLDRFQEMLHLVNPQEVSNTLWAVATMGQQVPLGQLQQMLDRFQQLLPQANPQDFSNTLLACAKLQHAPPQLQQMLERFQQVLHSANPQDVSNTLWAVATMGQQLPHRQLQQMLERFQQVLHSAKPQNVSNTLLACAKLQHAPLQLQQMLDHFQQVLHLAKPQEVSNTLWAIATMGQSVPPHQLQQMLDRFQQLLPDVKPQEVSNTSLACAKLQFAPLQLLSALEQQPVQLQKFLAAAKPQDLANTAWACGQLGYRSKQLPGELLHQAARLLQSIGGAGGFTVQDLCTLCWSAAVMDMQQCVSLVLQLATAVTQMWGSTLDEDLQQLYQVHLWLLDSSLPAPGRGLSGVLSQQQLQQCRASWELSLAAATASTKTSGFQRDVFAAAQRLPAGVWYTSPQLEQVTADGALSIDIAATTAAGVRVAIEADGPSHFIQPGNSLTGGTLFRNRALAARGYVVLSIPGWKWQQLRGADSKQQYLLAKLQSLQQHTTHPTQPQSAGSTAAVQQPAPAACKRRVVRQPGRTSSVQQQQQQPTAGLQLGGVAAAGLAAAAAEALAADSDQGSPRRRRRRTKAG